jgi:hypothetical protein
LVKRYLIVADESLPPDAYANVVLADPTIAPCWFHVLTPRSARPTESLPAYLSTALNRLYEVGVIATADLTDAAPLDAIAHTLELRSIDEIIVIEGGCDRSRWVQPDLPERIRRAFPSTTVLHLTADATGIMGPAKSS